jgi:hypothetical protein
MVGWILWRQRWRRQNKRPARAGLSGVEISGFRFRVNSEFVTTGENQGISWN